MTRSLHGFLEVIGIDSGLPSRRPARRVGAREPGMSCRVSEELSCRISPYGEQVRCHGRDAAKRAWSEGKTREEGLGPARERGKLCRSANYAPADRQILDQWKAASGRRTGGS